MYEAATGRVPFIGNNYLSVISQVLNEEPRPLREQRPELSEEFEAIVLRAMEKVREARYASANELLADLTALLDDPTRSTERARITGPRRKAGRTRSPLKIMTWIAVVLVVIAAVATTVVMLFGGNEVIKEAREHRGSAVIPTPVAVDAAPPVEIDAAPEAETMEVTIRTEPPGADVQVEGVDKGPAPVTLKLVVHDHFTQVVASAPDYEDKTITINTYVNKDTQYTLKLKKSVKPATSPHPTGGRPPDRPRPEPDKPKTGGELNGNPFKQVPPRQ
jgi:hypothetical protein